MSDSPPDIAGSTVEASQTLFFNRIWISATGKSTVSEIWNSKFSGAKALFFLSRYPFMVFAVLFCANTLITNTSETLCGNSVQCGGYVRHGFNWIIRNRFILAILGLTGAANVTVGISYIASGKPKVGSSVFGNTCDLISKSFAPELQLVTQILALILDVLVFTFTFAKTIRHTIEMRNVGLGNGLGYFILRDGTMYFLFIRFPVFFYHKTLTVMAFRAKLLFGVVGTILYFGVVGSCLEIVTDMSGPLTIILINRLVLNLRQVSHIQEGNTPKLGAIGTIQEPAFATNSILGNLGAPLRVGPAEDYDDDETKEIVFNDGAEVVEERGIANLMEVIEEPRNPSDV
ncbi:hypothetical protein BD410DRAFT_808395 [Rickenella mellea]|uniref:Uncharacterized protein n=1 Tax=Rickenella mellea TaxID=50990 RepID=A0A4Y7PLG7_9AGAM|nr:hypothetical protein BD410DRAFT_808395 [Rickenella mellea]